MKYRTIDLCAGIGGIRRGFELTGSFENVLSAEIDHYACETYTHLFGDNPINDITSEKFKALVETVKYDVLLAGFPCQTFSRVGKQQGFRDTTRGTIFFDIADIISRTNPRAVFLENVENLVSHDEGNTINTIVNTLENELGYRIIGVSLDENGNYCYNRSSLVRNSKYFGVPQNRPRVYIMAFSKKIYGNAVKLLQMPLPEHGDEIVFESLNEVLEHSVDDKYYMAQGYLDTLKAHKERNHNKGNGFGYCIVNGADKDSPIANALLATGGSGKERNLVYQPKEGIAGKIVCGKKTPLNSEGIRVMTPKEWGRLQGFVGYGFIDENGNDVFSFPEKTTDGQKYKQLGNSVSIPVIKKMADFMFDCFKLLESEQNEIVNSLSQNMPYFTKKDVMDVLNLNASQASHLLKKMMQNGEIVRISKGRATRYTNKKSESNIVPFSNEEKVIELARFKGKITANEIQKELGFSFSYSNVLLCALVKKGLLIRCSRGIYRTEAAE